MRPPVEASQALFVRRSVPHDLPIHDSPVLSADSRFSARRDALGTRTRHSAVARTSPYLQPSEHPAHRCWAQSIRPAGSADRHRRAHRGAQTPIAALASLPRLLPGRACCQACCQAGRAGLAAGTGRAAAFVFRKLGCACALERSSRQPAALSCALAPVLSCEGGICNASAAIHAISSWGAAGGWQAGPLRAQPRAPPPSTHMHGRQKGRRILLPNPATATVPATRGERGACWTGRVWQVEAQLAGRISGSPEAAAAPGREPAAAATVA
jgi:hypothetical protein